MIRLLKFLIIFIFLIMQSALQAQNHKQQTTNEKQDQQSVEEVGKKITEMPQKRIKLSASKKNSTSPQVQKKTSTVPPIEKQHEKNNSSIKKSKPVVKKTVYLKTEKAN